ncbi:MAG: hypothetical protein IKH11_00740 [Bacteroidales bacterium]|nr:hypothetical protein [Bacteroidales bacterium]
MNTTKFIIAAAFALALLSSCDLEHKNQEYVEMSPVRMYQITGIKFCGPWTIMPAFTSTYNFDTAFDKESRAFYSSIDTSLVYKGWVHKATSSHPADYWCAADMRLTSIDVITLEDYDASHPAGSSLNDILQIKYWFKYQLITKPLAEFGYGDLMLMDYFPYEDGRNSISFDTLDPEYTSPREIKHEIRIEDAFGNTFTANSESDIWTEIVLT